MSGERHATTGASAGAAVLAAGRFAFRRRAGRRSLRFGARLAGLIAIEAERRRLFLWLPVCFGLGILLYFSADAEPAVWAPFAATVILAALAALARAHWRRQATAIALAAVFAGFAAAVLRSALVAAPILSRTTTGTLTGFVEGVEERANGARLVIAPLSFATLDAGALPARVRLSTRGRSTVKAGDFIEATARLLPPPEPARPGGYDFARDAFFQRLGAVGSIAGAIKLGAPPRPPDWRLRANAGIDQARNVLTARIAQAFGGQAGAVAAALVTGKRGLITEETNDALRAAGLYHIVSISGLHMVIAAGTFFWTARALLALVPAVALGWPVKKIAAAIAMLGATAYCIFSGSEVATERSLVMTLVLLGAILVDRPALSMRNLAIAALIVLAREPESLLGPSFQMSFAAVAGLIAFCERPREGAEEGRPRPGPLARLAHLVWRATLGVVVTTCVATLATAPFSAYHFQTLNPLGVIGNALALPFISLAIMPAAVFGVLAYPFGLDWPAWWAMSVATGPVLLAAKAVATIERSTVVVPAFGLAALGCLVLAIVWVTLWSTALRWFAAIPAVLGLLLAASPERSHVLVDRSASGAAVRGGDGRLALLGRPSGFVAEQWLKADGDRRRSSDPSLNGAAACDTLGCVARLPDGRAVALVKDKRAFAEDCRRAAIVISPLAAPPTCRSPLVLDREALAKTGSVAVTLGDGAFVLSAARDLAAVRPWLRRPEPRPRKGAGSPANPVAGPGAAPGASDSAPIDLEPLQ